jgi:hypothetical protein
MNLLMDRFTVLSQIETTAVCFILWDLLPKVSFHAINISICVSFKFYNTAVYIYESTNIMINLSLKMELPIIKLCSVVAVWISKDNMYWLQNFFKDPWNTFDFITVIGSIIDALVIELGVSKTEVILTS